MSKKIFIVSATPRKGGNSDILAEEFAKGARNAGHYVDKVNVKDIDLRFCTGCLACQRTCDARCVVNDGMNALYDRVRAADVLAFATPVYYYGMSGQLKTFLDRLNPLFPLKNSFGKVYLIATAADTDASATDGAVTGLQGWLDCFEGVELAGVVKGLGMENVGEAEGNAACRRAYDLGKSL